jgi:hypothetical protein
MPALLGLPVGWRRPAPPPARRLAAPSRLCPLPSPLYPPPPPPPPATPHCKVVGLDGMYPYGIVDVCPDHVAGCAPGQYISREKWGKVGPRRAAPRTPPYQHTHAPPARVRRQLPRTTQPLRALARHAWRAEARARPRAPCRWAG